MALAKGRLVFARDGCIVRDQVEMDGSIRERKLLELNSAKMGDCMVTPPN
jgi:hypothetical protein